ncbi:cytochrome c [Inquilinus sp. Marseille-Q2685]|uniref:c-type cytochrome n=1 Tax=Inquilinus sp. Marseille-Q2685 TaxID=2866581 RepID=UPI001CE497B8|nr:cytochrome c [Inquilinus sp. Marseille-Q2685]
MVLGVAGAVAGGAGLWWLGTRPPRIDPTDARQVAAGAAFYSQNCASCHGADLQGQANWRERLPSGRLPAPPHDESGHTWHHPDAVLFEIVKNGYGELAPPGYETDMPRFVGILSDQEIADVLAFIKSRWPRDVQMRQSRANSP